MSNRYLILGMNSHNAFHFAKRNDLCHSCFNVITTPQQLKGYRGEVTLILLHYWDMERGLTDTTVFNEELYWFELNNKVLRMDVEDILQLKDTQ